MPGFPESDGERQDRAEVPGPVPCGEQILGWRTAARLGSALAFGMAAGIPLANILLYGVAVLGPSAACWAILHSSALMRRLRPRPIPVAHCRPIELLAADLRRVRRDLERPGVPMARRRGMWLAYDALLVQACAAIGITHELDSLADGIDREAERLRIEEALCSAGMAIR